MIDPPKMLMAIDPGKYTGWAIINNGFDTSFGICNGLEEFANWLEEQPIPDVIVYEGYKLFKNKALKQSGSQMDAPQAIGILKSYALRKKVPAHVQFSDILPIAQLWSKMPLPKNHDISHGISAYNHGFYWLVKNKMVQIKV